MTSKAGISPFRQITSRAWLRLHAGAGARWAATTRSVRQPSVQSPTPRFKRAPLQSIGVARTYSQAGQSKAWTFEEIQKLTSEATPRVVIVDTREPGELQQTGRIPGAINIPITSAPDSFHIKDEEFEDRFGYPRPEKDSEVVFYCKAGVRSRAAAGLARDAGWKKVGEYPGSWVDWFEKGGKVERQ